MDYKHIAALLRKGDRYSLKRAETLLFNHLQYFYCVPYPWKDMADSFVWLGRLEWVRRDYEKSIQYLRNALEIFSCKQYKQSEARTRLKIAACLVRVRRFQQAQDEVVMANVVAGGLGINFQDEIRQHSNSVFQSIQRCKRES